MLVRVMPNYTRRQSYLYTIFDPPCTERLGASTTRTPEAENFSHVQVGCDLGPLPSFLKVTPRRFIQLQDPQVRRCAAGRQREREEPVESFGISWSSCFHLTAIPLVGAQPAYVRAVSPTAAGCVRAYP